MSLLLTIGMSFYSLQNIRNISSVEYDKVIRSKDDAYRSVPLDSSIDIEARLEVARYFYINDGEAILYLGNDNRPRTFVPSETDRVERRRELDAIELNSRLKNEVYFRFKLMILICSIAFVLFIILILYKKRQEWGTDPN